MEKLYLLVVEGDIEPSIKGPYKTTGGRLKAARQIRQRTDEDGVYRLNVDADGTPTVFSFSGSEMA